MATGHPTAIITGGTGGMGLATATLMGVDHRIVLADLDRTRLDAAVRELAIAGVDAVGVVCDITDKASVEHLFHCAESGGDHVRAVVHAAGISPHMGSAERIARINATGTVNVARAFLARAADGDAVVNVASTAGYSIPKVLRPDPRLPPRRAPTRGLREGDRRSCEARRPKVETRAGLRDQQELRPLVQPCPRCRVRRAGSTGRLHLLQGASTPRWDGWRRTTAPAT